MSMNDKIDLETTQQLLRHARRDPDPVTCFIFGADGDELQEAIIVVKGNAMVQQILADLETKGLTGRSDITSMVRTQEKTT